MVHEPVWMSVALAVAVWTCALLALPALTDAVLEATRVAARYTISRS